MTRLLITGMFTTAIILQHINVQAQRFESDILVSFGSGYVSNTYLIPLVPEWDRTRITTFYYLTPSGQIRWSGDGRSLSVSGIGNILQLFDENQAWAGGFLTSMFRQRITSSLTARAVGGLNMHSSTYSRNMQWLQAGLEWSPSLFTRVEASAGPAWRTISGIAGDETISSRYDAYGIGFEYWPGYRWRLQLNYYSSLDHITRPGDSFSGTVSLTRYLPRGAEITLQSGVEQYATEFQIGPSGGNGIQGDISLSAQPVFMDNEPFWGRTFRTPVIPETMQQTTNGTENETITLEDRFHRTTLRITLPVSRNINLTGSASGLLWLSSQDDSVEPDFQVSAGLQIPVPVQRIRAGKINSVRWEGGHGETSTLTVRYRGSHTLYVTGDFNDWDYPGIPLIQTGRNRYRVEIDLPSGVYEYRISKRNENGYEWLAFPDDTATTSDGFGGENARVFIEF
jgi:hypothetical protein